MLTFFAKPTGFKRELGSTLIAISWETRLKSSARATLFCSIIYVVLPNYPPKGKLWRVWSNIRVSARIQIWASAHNPTGYTATPYRAFECASLTFL